MHPTTQTKAIPSGEQMQDFCLALEDHSASFERTMDRLRKVPDDGNALGALFRIAHTLKGDASMCGFGLVVPLLHAMESVLSRVRAMEVPFTDAIGDLVYLVVDSIQSSVDSLLATHTIDASRIGYLDSRVASIATTSARLVDESARAFISGKSESPGLRPHNTAYPNGAQSDLVLFRQLASQLDARSPALRARSTRVVQIALRANALAGSPVSPQQLEAAALIHDLGMMFLPDALWLRPGALNDADRRALRSHPELGGAIISRIPGWEEAARMVREHHEMPNGRGYPRGLFGKEICSGAHLLAIIDAFESIMLKQSNRGRTRSFIRAVAEVNANPQQFAIEWLEPFNRATRDVLRI